MIDLWTNTFRVLTTHTLSDVLFGAMFLVFGLYLFRKKSVGVGYSHRLFLWFLIIALVQLVLLMADLWVEWHRPSCGAACRFFFPPYSNYYFNQVIVKWI